MVGALRSMSLIWPHPSGNPPLVAEGGASPRPLESRPHRRPDLERGPHWLIIGAVALLIALSFEFINGFHDTANAVATVISTRSLAPQVAGAWSGVANLAGVLLSSGAAAFAIIALLPAQRPGRERQTPN